MTIIRITFPWGRYHAHPWGMNPGRVREAEWPPSPWRLLRSVAAAWFRTHPGQPLSEEAKELIVALAGQLPEIGFGPVSFACTTHYQPNYGVSDTDDRRSAVYKTRRHENHFVALSGPVYFRWPQLSLNDAQRMLLVELLGSLSYLGRADSLCTVELLDEEAPVTTGLGWACPAVGPDGQPRQVIRSDHRDVFCPDLTSFQVTDLWISRARLKDHQSNMAPPHLTDLVIEAGYHTDGGRLVSYRMPKGWPQQFIVRTAKRSRPGRHSPLEGERVIRYLRFDLQCRVPVPQRFIVPLAEQFRRRVSAAFIRAFPGQRSFALFGHKNDRPDGIIGEHQHAFYLPLPKDGEPGASLTEFHVWCPMGFTKSEADVLQMVDRLEWAKGRYPAKPVLTMMAKDAPADLPFSLGNGPAAREWRSVTPFVPPRHFYRGSLKRMRLRPQDTPENQLAECLRLAGFNEPVMVHRLAMAQQPEPLTALPPQPAWDIVRTPTEELEQLDKVYVHDNGDGVERRTGLYMQLSFNDPVVLPFPAFGHSAHFGLGLFTPVK